MKRFLLSAVGTAAGCQYLRTEETWTPRLRAYLASCAWLNDSGWDEFVDNAVVGQAFVVPKMFAIVRLADDEDAVPILEATLERSAEPLRAP